MQNIVSYQDDNMLSGYTAETFNQPVKRWSGEAAGRSVNQMFCWRLRLELLEVIVVSLPADSCSHHFYLWAHLHSRVSHLALIGCNAVWHTHTHTHTHTHRDRETISHTRKTLISLVQTFTSPPLSLSDTCCMCNGGIMSSSSRRFTHRVSQGPSTWKHFCV